MQTYEILVQNRAVRGNSKDMTLVRTSVGIDQVHVLFDSAEWLEFPVTITFAQGDELITQSLLVTTLNDSEWVAESTVTVPYEVIDMTGPIRVTIQGTDADGRHIITAKGSPLSVEESGDVVIGDLPSDAPTIDQWQQAYAQAMAAASAAQSVVDDMRSQIESIVAEAIASIPQQEAYGPATRSDLGLIKVGSGLAIMDDGTLSSSASGGMSTNQAAALANLSKLAYLCFDVEFDINGELKDTAKVKRSVLPLAGTTVTGMVMVDNETIVVDAEGKISSPVYILPIASSDALGGVKVGDNVTVSDEGELGVPVSTSESLGVVRPDGVTITIDEDGTLTASGGGGGGGGYILPKAAKNQLGGVKVGNGLSIDRNGVLSIDTGIADWTVF